MAIGKKLPTIVKMGMLVFLAAPGVSTADDASCWDTRRQLAPGKGFPFSILFGALPAEVARCEGEGALLMTELQTIRADPSVLEKENQANNGHGGRLNNRWDCCKNWVGFRCQHYPEKQGSTGYGRTYLEGKLTGVCDKDVQSRPKVPVPGYDPLDKSGVVKQPPGGTGNMFKQMRP